MTYLRFLFGSTLSLLAAAVAINVVVDPGGIYRDGRLNPSAYANALVKSSHGLWWPENSYDERSLKRALAMQSGGVDCIVLGSSHIMEIGSKRDIRPLGGECESVLNLGVSGASIEDQITLAHLALQNRRPKKIVFSVDPWTLAFGKDPRWSQYKTDYFKAYSVIMSKAGSAEVRRDDVFISKLKNLLSIEYTIRSVRKVIRDSRSNLAPIALAPAVDESTGGDNPVLLPDGSLIYSAKYLSDNRAPKIPIGGDTYKTDGELNQKHAIETYRSLILWVKNQGVAPILLLTPYHENVWKSRHSPTLAALQTTESIVSGMARDLNIKLIGTYDPHKAGCLSAEFHDFMHPTTRCLAKLRAR